VRLKYWMKRSVVGFSSHRPGLSTTAVNDRFVLGKVSLVQDYFRVLRFSPQQCSIIFSYGCCCTRTKIEDWFLAAKKCSLGYRGALNRNVPYLHPKKALPLPGERAACLSVANMNIPFYHNTNTNHA